MSQRPATYNLNEIKSFLSTKIIEQHFKRSHRDPQRTTQNEIKLLISTYYFLIELYKLKGGDQPETQLHIHQGRKNHLHPNHLKNGPLSDQRFAHLSPPKFRFSSQISVLLLPFHKHKHTNIWLISSHMFFL